MSMTVLKTRNKIHWDYKLIQKTDIKKHTKNKVLLTPTYALSHTTMY
jgi:hypothetical protein